jgi:biopolymer transport protein ExbB/TolQ
LLKLSLKTNYMESPKTSFNQEAASYSKIEGTPFGKSRLAVDWGRDDLERRIGFKGGRFTTPSTTLSLITALLLTVAFYAAVIFIRQQWPQFGWFSDMFLERGPCPYPTMLLFFWAASLLFFKWGKLKLQKKALELSIMPLEPDFVLTPATARAVRERMGQLVDNPNHFLLLNRIDLALANLHNVGHPGDVATILKIQAENDEAQIGSSYGLINGFMWGIPVLGFIGTVLGLSVAIGSFARVIQAGGDMDVIRSSLQSVTGGLATAFETTLVALVCALILQLIVSFLQTDESRFLDDCNEVCHKRVAGRLRIAQS